MKNIIKSLIFLIIAFGLFGCYDGTGDQGRAVLLDFKMTDQPFVPLADNEFDIKVKETAYFPVGFSFNTPSVFKTENVKLFNITRGKEKEVVDAVKMGNGFDGALTDEGKPDSKIILNLRPKRNSHYKLVIKDFRNFYDQESYHLVNGGVKGDGFSYVYDGPDAGTLTYDLGGIIPPTPVANPKLTVETVRPTFTPSHNIIYPLKFIETTSSTTNFTFDITNLMASDIDVIDATTGLSVIGPVRRINSRINRSIANKYKCCS